MQRLHGTDHANEKQDQISCSQMPLLVLCAAFTVRIYLYNVRF